jgi:hypothetical protein
MNGCLFWIKNFKGCEQTDMLGRGVCNKKLEVDPGVYVHSTNEST